MKTVTVVGVGALGSHFVLLARNLAKLRVIDFDRVEAKNTLSQFHAKTQIGKSKVEAMKQTMAFLYGTKLDTNSNKLVEANAEALLAKSDLVVDCLDNGASRKVLQDYVRRAGIECVHAGVAPDGTFGRVIWDQSFQIDYEGTQGAATCEAGEHLPFLATVGAYLARSVQEFLTKGKRTGFSISSTNVVAV